MKIRSLVTTSGAAALALAVWTIPAISQGPLYDRIKASIPYPVTLGDKVLQPGDYTIQQLPSQSSSRVLLFYTRDGMKFETSAMTIPALDPNTARNTRLILNKAGDDYYIDKIWVQGKDYGYELPVPDALKSREKERMTPTTVAGTYSSSSSTDMVTSQESTNTVTQSAAANTPPTNTDVATSTTPAAPSTPVTTSATTSTTTATETAQSAPPPATSSTPSTGSADRSMTPDQAAPAPATMPATAANWLLMLLGGSTLSGAGMMLRRKR